MIVLDTNVISEIFRPQPEPRVLAWLESLTDDVAITSITLAELLVGACRANRAVCATGNLKDFEATGVDVANPRRE